MIKDLSDKFDISMRTDSVTRLGPYSLQDDLHHDEMAKNTADEEIADQRTREQDDADSAAAEATIEVTLGALLLGMNPTGGESWTLKESVMAGMRSEIRWAAKALLGEPSWKYFSLDIWRN